MEDLLTKGNQLENIQEQVAIARKKAESERVLRLLNKRIEYLRFGMLALQNKNPSEAVKAFFSYFKILEEIKQVPEERLSPTYFDLKKDASELLMINGIYWELVKLYDKINLPSKEKDFLHYMHQYILFSKNMPFQKICAETILKHIQQGNPRHIREFKNAATILGEKVNCVITTALSSEIQPETFWKCLQWREQVLKKNLFGRAFIRLYYAIGPLIAFIIRFLPKQWKQILGKSLDTIARFL